MNKLWKNKGDLLILFTMIVLSVIITMYIVPNEVNKELDLYSSNYSGKKGTKALKLLARGLGYNVSELEYFEGLSYEHDVLILISPVIELSVEEKTKLRDWVVSGGVLICDQAVLEEDDILSGLITSSAILQESDNPLAYGIDETEWVNNEFFPFTADPDYKNIFHDNGLSRIVELKFGLGKIIRLSSPVVMTNQYLSLLDNSVLSINLFHYALASKKDGNIVFDESHYHGKTGQDQSANGLLATMLISTPWGWFVISLALAGMCFVWMKGKRFGSTIRPEGVCRRAKLEFVYSSGACWHKSGARGLMFEMNYKWVRTRFAEALGLPLNSDNRTMADCIANRTTSDTDKYLSILDRSDNVHGSSSNHEIKELLRELAKIELEISDGYGKGK